MIALTLPMPPTINTAYGHTKGRMYIKHAGRAYRLAVAEIVAAAGHPKLTGRLALFVAVHPATRAKQDLDNRSKALQDALTHAGVWLDDEQIDSLHLVRREVVKGGMVKIVITELETA
ncbi:RusA family crossover junction endodeoxyribonuclease [Massilia sp. PWRC2]|uniref:RusA family crossover junction endodeoxyribonuclease n=1 Tax=Massilia sp. PWRC2 TaxID=2804626 RepID=UPI003CE7E3C3